ncbi:MAG: prepilin-type N-terminal cleavage/methylation domain-containing protein [Verrucomicrobia bacterium]|nr:prepilin-type N-terminal cleavage/methylation domain-containing protein [Deltaproteobacteria bacterium]
MRGFTLLEVMVALAIMASVVMTVLGSVNYHLSLLTAERDNSTLTLLARARLVELEKQVGLPQKSEGTFTPLHPDVIWRAELFATKYPALQKLVVRVQRSGDKREVALVRYILK